MSKKKVVCFSIAGAVAGIALAVGISAWLVCNRTYNNWLECTGLKR